MGNRSRQQQTCTTGSLSAPPASSAVFASAFGRKRQGGRQTNPAHLNGKNGSLKSEGAGSDCSPPAPNPNNQTNFGEIDAVLNPMFKNTAPERKIPARKARRRD
jgi:hypothetical protein